MSKLLQFNKISPLHLFVLFQIVILIHLFLPCNSFSLSQVFKHFNKISCVQTQITGW